MLQPPAAFAGFIAGSLPEPLPSLPLPLSVHRAVVIDLEETYRRAAQRAYLD